MMSRTASRATRASWTTSRTISQAAPSSRTNHRLKDNLTGDLKDDLSWWIPCRRQVDWLALSVRTSRNTFRGYKWRFTNERNTNMRAVGKVKHVSLQGVNQYTFVLIFQWMETHFQVAEQICKIGWKIVLLADDRKNRVEISTFGGRSQKSGEN